MLYTIFNILSFFFNKTAISLVLTGIALVRTDRFFFIMPFLPLTGFWIMDYIYEYEFFYLSEYAELLIASIFFFRMFSHKRLDSHRIFLLSLAVCSLPGLILARQSFMQSLFLSIMFFLSAGVYDHFTILITNFLKTKKDFLTHIKHSSNAQREKIHVINDLPIKTIITKINISHYLAQWSKFLNLYFADVSCVIWLVLHYLIRFFQSYHRNIDLEYYRGGGIWGSNHLIQILILLFPFIKFKTVFAAAIITILINFSKGGYIAIIVYLLCELCFSSHKNKVIKQFFFTTTALVLITFAMENSTISELVSIFKKSLGINEEQINLSAITQKILSDYGRIDIYSIALNLPFENYLIGSGLGSFRWILYEYSTLPLFSNAHNLYLTTLVEGGIAFFSFFMFFLLRLLRSAYLLDKSIFSCLITFCIYGLFSGQIYEVYFPVTLIDYFYLLFIYAYLNSMKNCSYQKTL